MTGARVVGPALAGLLVTTVGFGWAFALDGFSYLAVLVALWMMDPREIRRAPVTPRGKGQVRQGLRYVRTIPELWVPLVMMAVIGTLSYNFQTVIPLFATRDMGGSDVTFTLLMSVVSVGALMGALVAARRKSVDISVVSWAALAFGVAMALLTVSPDLALAYLFSLALGFTSTTFMTTSTAIVQIRSDPSMRGRVLALQAIVFLGSTPIGAPIVGYVSQHYGARYGLAIGALAGLAAAAFGFFMLHRAGDDELAEDAEADALAYQLTSRRPA
jgi:predicted MFS family arabinose efflux permease